MYCILRFVLSFCFIEKVCSRHITVQIYMTFYFCCVFISAERKEVSLFETFLLTVIMLTIYKKNCTMNVFPLKWNVFQFKK